MDTFIDHNIIICALKVFLDIVCRVCVELGILRQVMVRVSFFILVFIPSLIVDA